MDRQQTNNAYVKFLTLAKKNGEEKAALAELGKRDLFFLLTRILGRRDVDNNWLYDRCREVQANPNGHLDLWAREHYKSTIITYGLTIQDIINDPELTIGIFSFNRPGAKAFLRQIKRELEDNKKLKELYPGVLWSNPQREAPKWSEDEGLIVRRKGNPKEATVEAWGLVDAMPTGRHYKIRVYDDVITEQHVTNPEQIQKALSAWELSLNLGSAQPCTRYGTANIDRYVGTRYHFNDPYREIMRRNTAIPRIYPGTKNGTVDGEPVLWSREMINKKRRDMGPYIFGCQILQDPKADEQQGFLREWIRYWSAQEWKGYNRYLLCDPAGEKKKENDYTVMLVIGLGPDQNYYLIDGLRDRLNLTERTKALIRFHKLYLPKEVGYEKYGKDSDIEHIEYVQDKENYRFNITPLGGPIPKLDRIRKLIPIFEQGRFFVPSVCYFMDYEEKQHDLVREFIEDEYVAFPVAVHDDIMDCLARIADPELGATFPMADIADKITRLRRNTQPQVEQYDPLRRMAI